MQRNSRHTLPRRAAFTLVELLVVIGIIAVILALASGAYFRFTASQPVKNTQARIMSINEILHNHWKKVIDDAKKEEVSKNPTLMLLAGGDVKVAKVIWKYVRLSEAFPMSFGEINNPPVYANGLVPPGMQKYNANYKKNLASLVAAKHNAQTEMAACLAMALSVSRLGSQTPLDKGWLRDTDGDSLDELIDDWGQPLYFFRFPTDNADLQASAPAVAAGAGQAKLRNPLDPEGTLLNATWYNTPITWGTQTNVKAGAIFESLFHPIQNSTGTVNYTIPVIVSSGPDLILGLSSPGMAPGAGAADNIYSYKLHIGQGTQQ
jgi:prepilin-type N-terminal cleavage/methylation domain-containing protein